MLKRNLWNEIFSAHCATTVCEVFQHRQAKERKESMECVQLEKEIESYLRGLGVARNERCVMFTPTNAGDRTG